MVLFMVFTSCDEVLGHVGPCWFAEDWMKELDIFGRVPVWVRSKMLGLFQTIPGKGWEGNGRGTRRRKGGANGSKSKGSKSKGCKGWKGWKEKVREKWEKKWASVPVPVPFLGQMALRKQCAGWAENIAKFLLILEEIVQWPMDTHGILCLRAMMPSYSIIFNHV